MSRRDPWTVGDPWEDGDPTTEAFGPSEDGRYQLGAVLGEGGMGQVLEAWDTRLRRTVALKVARPGSAAEARLLQEARLGAQLRHPAVIPVLDAGTLADGRRFVVVPRLTGRTLRDHLADAPAPRLDLLPALVEAAEAVGHAHAQGIVHRDLTAGNVFVEDDGTAVVLDWGLARPVAGEDTARWSEEVLRGGDTPQTLAGTVVGTPGYMSPEQALGASVDPRADVWSLGALLHVLICGAPPFGHLEDPERQRALGHADVPDPRSVFPGLEGVPGAVVSVCLEALARDPARRPPDGCRFAAALRSALTPEAAPTPRAGWGPRLALAGIVGLAAFGVGRTLAPPAVDTATRAALHLERALRAADHERWPEAARHARASLEGRPSALARGVLSSATAGWQAHRLSTAPRPETCDEARLLPDARVVCADGREVGVWSLDGTERWRRVLEAQGPRLVVHGDVVGVWSNDHDLARLDLSTGVDAERWWRACCLWAWEDGVSGAWVQASDRVFRLDATTDAGWPLPVPPVDRALIWQEGAQAFAIRNQWDLVRWDPELGDWQGVHRLPPPERYDGLDRVRVSPSGDVVLTTFQGWVRRGTDVDGDWWRLPGRARDVQLSPDGTLLAAAVHGVGVVVLDARNGAELLRLPHEAAAAVRWQDHDELAVVGDALEVWRIEVGGWARQLQIGPGITALAWEPHDDLLAVATAEFAAWLEAPGRQRGRLPASAGVMKDVDWSPDGQQLLATRSVAPSLSLVHLGSGEVRGLGVVRGAVRRVSWTAPDAISYAGYDHVGPQLVDPTTETRHSQVGVNDMTVQDLAAGPDGTVWHLGLEGRVARVDADARAVALVGRAPAGATHIAVGPDAAPWVVAEDGLHRLDAASEAFVRITKLASTATAFALSPDGMWVVVGTLDGRAHVLTADGELAASLDHGRERVSALAFGEGVLFSGGWDGTVRTWRVDAWDAGAPSPVSEKP